jgi:hypothetical protein
MPRYCAIWPDMGTVVDMEQALSTALSSDIMSITLFRRLPVLGYTQGHQTSSLFPPRASAKQGQGGNMGELHLR